MRLRLLPCMLITLMISPLLPLAAQSTRTASGAIEYAFTNLQVQWRFIRATTVSDGFDREYSVMERVCYAQSDGCRWETTSESVIVHESEREPIGPTTATVWTESLPKLTARVMAMLGKNGWEMVGEAPVPTFWTQQSTVLAFKRVGAR